MLLTIFFRLGILKNGQLKSVDTIPNLKKQFGKGFSVTLKLKQQMEANGDTDEVDSKSTVGYIPLEKVKVDEDVREKIAKEVKNVFGKENVEFYETHIVSEWLLLQVTTFYPIYFFLFYLRGC